MMITHLLLLFSLVFFSLSASADEKEEVLVFAAASLTNVLNDIAEDYQRQTGKSIRLSFASSAILARQIEFGAPAALYISANRQWIDYLQKKTLLAPDGLTRLARNRLVLIAPATGQARKRVPVTQALSSPGTGRLAIAAPDTVPAGIYAKIALERLGLWPDIQSRLAPTANVRSALALVESGAVSFGIVYATDATISPKVTVISAVPEELHPPIEYWSGIVKKNDGPAARQFDGFLQTKSAKLRFQAYGFLMAESTPGPETGQ